MTRKALAALAVLSTFIFVIATDVGIAAAQKPAQKSSKMVGTWDVSIKHMSGRVVNEQWIVTDQDGAKMKGRVKTARADLPLEGTVDGGKIEVKVTVNDMRYNIFLGTLQGDEIKGTIQVKGTGPQVGDDGTFSAKRAAPAP